MPPSKLYIYYQNDKATLQQSLKITKQVEENTY